MIEKKINKVVVLATGGTIAGWASDVNSPNNYKPGHLDVKQLLNTLSVSLCDVVTEQLAQIDSKDADDDLWRILLERAAYWLEQSDVVGLVVTHGTDTLEETAYFMQAVLKPSKPVVLTCAMRAANDPESDGPGNLQDALALAADKGQSGVLVVCAGDVHAAHEIQKIHSLRLNPFSSGDFGPMGRMSNGQFKNLRSQSSAHWPQPLPTLQHLLAHKRWPRVHLVVSHAGVDGSVVRAVQALDPPDGWVVAGTGNGTLNHDLQAALEKAQLQGARVVRASRAR
jgi:L-asparaginase